MVARAYSVAFQGVEARIVEVQCAVTPGLPAFSIVGSNCKPIFELFSFYTLKCLHNLKLSSPQLGATALWRHSLLNHQAALLRIR